jgi:hypothetical protein
MKAPAPYRYPPEVVFAAERLLGSALALVTETDPGEWPQTAQGARSLLAECGRVWELVRP